MKGLRASKSVIVLAAAVATLAAGPALAADAPHQLLGSWKVQNETIDETYSGSKAIGQVTFFADHLTIDSGAPAAASIVAASESSGCLMPTDPISLKLVGSGPQRVLYLTWMAANPFGPQITPVSSAMTILKLSKKSVVLMGNGFNGCGGIGVARFSYLTRP